MSDIVTIARSALTELRCADGQASGARAAHEFVGPGLTAASSASPVRMQCRNDGRTSGRPGPFYCCCTDRTPGSHECQACERSVGPCHCS